MDKVRDEEAQWAEKTRQAEAEVEKLGYLRQGIYHHRVAWAENDMFRHGAHCATLHWLTAVNNVNYIRWFENARMSWVDRLTENIDPKLRDDIVQGTNVGMILATTFCRYRRPVSYPDTVLIGQAVLPMKKPDRFAVKYIAYSVAQQTTAALGEQEMFAYDFNKLSKANVPEEVAAALKEWYYKGE